MKKLAFSFIALTALSFQAEAQEVNYKGTAKCPEYWHMGSGSCQISFDGKTVYASGSRGSANWSECKKTGKDTFRCDQANSASTNRSVIVTIGKSPSIRGVEEKI